jgi:hypothetical protein
MTAPDYVQIYRQCDVKKRKGERYTWVSVLVAPIVLRFSAGAWLADPRGNYLRIRFAGRSWIFNKRTGRPYAVDGDALHAGYRLARRFRT